MFNRHSPPDALSWLNQSGHGASLVATAHRMLQLQECINGALPAPLNAACRILRYQDDALTLGVPTAAHSGKLRQVVPRLAAALQANGWQVNEIRVRVQARQPFPPPETPRDPRPTISPEGVDAFTQLRNTLPEGPLAQALTRLIERRQT